ncbi:MAG: hypothetical protein H0X38_03705 [Planctomycetes bacterium]|nr:hypothetical protein [Planctomycetota bacterium]
MHLLLLVDHKWRDLPGHAWLALSAERRGHRIDLVRNGFHLDAAWRTRPDVLIVNHVLDVESQRQAKLLAAAGTDTVVLPTEGILALQGARDLHAGVGGDYAGVARFCVWNEPMRERMLEHRVMPSERIAVIGCPRFDFYQPPVSSVVPDRRQAAARFQVDPARPTVLWATNFCAASQFTRNPEFHRQDWAKLGLSRVFGDCDQHGLADLRCRDQSAAVMRDFVERNPEVQLVVKPHPADDLTFFQAFVASCPAGRVTLVKTAYIWEVLPLADVLVKRSCTTGMEAWMRGLPTIELQPDPRRNYYCPEHASGSHLVESGEQLTERVRAVLAGEPLPAGLAEARERFIARWCYRNDGRSTGRFLDVLDALAEERRQAGRKPITAGRPAPFGWRRKLRSRLLMAGDYWLHDRRLYGWFGRMDHQGRMDKWFTYRAAAAWRARLAGIQSHDAAAAHPVPSLSSLGGMA